MKILFATFWQMPHVGGVNQYINVISKELEKQGHQVDVLAHYPDMHKIYLQRYRRQDAFRWTLSGQSVEKKKLMDRVFPEVYAYYQQNLPYVEPWIRWREIERYLFELIASLFDLRQYDLIHTHDLLATRALWRVKPDHIPLVYKAHGLVASVHLFNGDIQNKEERKWTYVAAEEYVAAMSCDALIVPSRWLARTLTEEFQVPQERVRIVPYGMEIPPFLERYAHEPYPPVHISPKQLILACPARLSSEKGQKTLIEAVARLKEERSDFICWLIGDGAQRSELENYCQVLGVTDKVIFLGDRSDVPALLRKADIMVLTSREDNLPHAIMEAQIAGKAIVASDGGGIPEMIRHGETGLIFAKGNSEQLATQLKRLMDEPDLRQQLGAKAKEWGHKQWSSQRLCERTLQVYEAARAAKREHQAHPLVEPELTGRYGLSKPAGGQRGEAARIFRFPTRHSFSEPEWQDLFRQLPQSYAIPDPFFVRTLAQE